MRENEGRKVGNMKYICALITVEDIARSRRLYETILKQKVVTDFGENVGFEGGFALHDRQHFKKLIDDKPIIVGSNSFELYFEDDNLAIIEESVDMEGLQFIHRIKEQPWRQQVMRFYDYDKNIIEIGERLEHEAYRLFKDGLSIEQICKFTYLSKEMIDKAIEENIE